MTMCQTCDDLRAVLDAALRDDGDWQTAQLAYCYQVQECTGYEVQISAIYVDTLEATA